MTTIYCRFTVLILAASSIAAQGQNQIGTPGFMGVLPQLPSYPVVAPGTLVTLFTTADFDWSMSGSRNTVLGRRCPRLLEYFCRIRRGPPRPHTDGWPKLKGRVARHPGAIWKRARFW